MAIRRKEIIFTHQRELKVKQNKHSKAREAASDQVVIGFSFASFDWFRERHKLSGPHSKEKQKQRNPGFFRHYIKKLL